MSYVCEQNDRGIVMPYVSKLEIVKNYNLNAMLYFVAYMRYRKMNIVAETFNCSNATVSMMIRRFSDDFSEALFERRTRTLTPTRFAFEILSKCERIMNELCDIYSLHDRFNE